MNLDDPLNQSFVTTVLCGLRHRLDLALALVQRGEEGRADALATLHEVEGITHDLVQVLRLHTRSGAAADEGDAADATDTDTD